MSRPMSTESPSSRRFVVWSAAITATVAILVLAGWWFRIAPLVRLAPLYPPVRFNTALGLLGAAAGLWGIALGRRSMLIIGGGVALMIGGASLVESIAGTSLGVARLVMRDTAWIEVLSPVPPGMSAASGLILTLIGAALVVLWLDRWHRLATMMAGTMGTIVIGLSVAILISQMTGVLSDSTRLGTSTDIGPHAALAFSVVGMAVVRYSWGQGDLAALLPDWLPVAAGAGVLVATVFFWRALLDDQRRLVAQQLRLEAGLVAYQMSGRFESGTRMLEQLGTLTTVATGRSTAPWMAASAQLLRSVEGLTALVWLDSTLSIRAIQPRSAETDPVIRRLPQLLAPIFRGRPEDSPRQPFGIYSARPSEPAHYVLLAPACSPNGCWGHLVALLETKTLLEGAVASVTPGYAVTISTGRTVVYHTPMAPPPIARWTQFYYFATAGSNWTIEIWPRPATLAALRSDLPVAVGGLGIVVSILLAATLQLVRSSVGTARRAERETLARALETAKDGLWETDLLTGEGTRSLAVWRRLGYAVDQAAPGGQEPFWTSLIHPEDRELRDSTLREHLAGNIDAFEMQYRVRANDGRWHWIIDRGRVVERGAKGHPVRMLGICADITEQRGAEQALAASEQRFRTMFESRLQFESLLDIDGTVLEANRTVLESVGAEADQIRGHKLWEMAWWNGQEQVDRLKAACAKASQGETVRYEEEIPAGPDRLSLLDLSLKPIRNGDGSVVQVLAEWRDVTERKRNDDTMRELTTLSTMGRLAAKVAHEINNPLAGIQNAFLLIKDAVPESHPHYRFVGAIDREIDRIASVTRQLYETYRPDDDTQGCSVPTVINDATSLLEQVNRSLGIAIQIDTARSPAIMPIPSGLLRQAVYNLVQNAIEASPPGGTVSVCAWKQGETFRLTVRDQGPGVPAGTQGRIFEAFVSTKIGLRTGGMGLGLSLVRRSVEAAGGWVTVRNPEGGGAEFAIQIPVGPPPAVSLRTESPVT